MINMDHLIMLGTYLLHFFFWAKSDIRFACLFLPLSEKSQSLAAFLTSSALTLFAFIKGANSDAKVVLPEPGKPIIKIIFINSYIVASLAKGFSSMGKCTKVAKNESAIDKYQA